MENNPSPLQLKRWEREEVQTKQSSYDAQDAC
jgi:hypothetical protein